MLFYSWKHPLIYLIPMCLPLVDSWRFALPLLTFRRSISLMQSWRALASIISKICRGKSMEPINVSRQGYRERKLLARTLHIDNGNQNVSAAPLFQQLTNCAQLFTLQIDFQWCKAKSGDLPEPSWEPPGSPPAYKWPCRLHWTARVQSSSQCGSWPAFRSTGTGACSSVGVGLGMGGERRERTRQEHFRINGPHSSVFPLAWRWNVHGVWEKASCFKSIILPPVAHSQNVKISFL